jgi:23S rRNA (adenine2503-C2)-methyltransferase
MKHEIKNFNLETLSAALQKLGLPKYTAKQVFAWLYQKGVDDFANMSDLSKETRALLVEHFTCGGLDLVKEEVSTDGTKKFLWRLRDEMMIESALIPDGGRLTLCVSSQVGCKYKCVFCVSGKGGFKRNLSQGEILGQFLNAQKISGQKITNVVFMGTGEPLDNLDNVAGAITLLTDTRAINFSKRKISISTSGIVEGLEKLAKLQLGTSVSLSLHAAKDALRSQLMPVNKKYPLKTVMKALGAYAGTQKIPVTFEYILIKNCNSSLEDAHDLAHFLKGIECKVNLIPCNASLHGLRAPSQQEVESFEQVIKNAGIFCTIRKSKGQDISAACGQLAAAWKKDEIGLTLLSGYLVSVNTEPIQGYLKSIPAFAAYGMFIVFYVMGTFIADLKDPLRIAAAILYGGWLSAVLIYFAELINLVVLFQLSRKLGQSYVEKKVSAKDQKIYSRLEQLSFVQIFVLRLVPFVSYRVLDLGFGLTRIDLRRYFLASMLGSFPRILWIQLPLAAIGTFSVSKMMVYFSSNPVLLAGYFTYTVVVSIAAVILYAKIFK